MPREFFFGDSLREMICLVLENQGGTHNFLIANILTFFFFFVMILDNSFLSSLNLSSLGIYICI